LICQVETSPEILLIYRSHLAMIAHKISAANTWCEAIKKLLKVGMYSSNSCAHDGSAPSSGGVFPSAFGVHGPGTEKAVKDLIDVRMHTCIE
jgi:hypothetical protein